MTDFVPERMLLARQLRGRTKRDLARALEVSEQLVGKWEDGSRIPDDAILLRLAVEMGLPAPFFNREAEAIADGANVSFRSLRTITSRDRDRACAFATLAGEIGNWISTRYQVPDVDLPDFSEMTPSVAAAEMRRTLKLGHGPLQSLVTLLESRGVRCFALGGNLRKADALSTWISDTPVVLFNVTKSAERSRNDAAHELGHLLLHRHLPAAGEQAEHQAVEFASEFLLPAERMVRDAPRVWSLGALLEMKSAWGVSAALMLKRMTTLRLISDWSARAMWQRLSAAGYRSSEPGGRAREHSEVLAQVVQHLWSTRKTVNAIATDLSLAESDVNACIQGMLPVTRTSTDRNVDTVAWREAIRLHR